MSSFNNPGNAIANAALTRDLPLPAGETECSFAQKLVAAAKGVDLHARLTHFSKYLRRTTDPPPVSDRVALRLAHLYHRA